jgi:riboflavin synthase alpha subunit
LTNDPTPGRHRRCSLTILDKTADSFPVSLLQYAQARTSLLREQPADSVNIESDSIAGYVEMLLQVRSS